LLGNQEKLTYDLQAIADQADEPNSQATPSEVSDNLRDLQRRQKLVGTNVSTVADRFQDFLAEAINNRLDEAESEIEQSQTIEERFSERIIKPIRQLDGNQIVRAGQLIELAKRTVTPDAIDKDSLKSSIADAIGKQNEVIEAMQEILAEMKDSETYQEIVNKVIEIKRTEDLIRYKERENKEVVGSGDIFDDVDGDGGGLFDDEEMPNNSDDKNTDDEKSGGENKELSKTKKDGDDE